MIRRGVAIATLASIAIVSSRGANASVSPTSTYRATFTVARYAAVLGANNRALSRADQIHLAERVLLLSSYYALDARLMVSLVTNESAWNTRAVSRAGARGLGQLMPATAAALNVDALETSENLDGTARYLRRMLNRYAAVSDGRARVALALAAYNAGAGAVERYRGIPPYPETRAYVVHVVGFWDRLRAALPEPDDGTIAIVQGARLPLAGAEVAAVRVPQSVLLPPLSPVIAFHRRPEQREFSPANAPLTSARTGGVTRTLGVQIEHHL